MAQFAIMTQTGRNKEAAALAGGTALNITEIAWGDGDRLPGGNETTLQNEQGRKAVQGSGTVDGALNTAFFEILLDVEEGPFVIREAGLFDADGDMIAVAHYDPSVNKPKDTVSAVLRIHVLFSDLQNLILQVVSTNAFVPTERTITAGTGLSGGGALSADRSLSVDFATSAETLAGNLANKTVSPATLKARIDALIDSAPGALDTLNELALAVQENVGEIATALAQLATSMRGANNLSELTDPAQARANIGAAATLTQAAVSPFLAPTSQNVVGATILAEYTGPLPIQFGDLCDGSVLKPRETDATDQGHGHTTGTWRCHGTINSNGGGTVFQKISE